MRQVVLHYDAEDAMWVVEVPSLPGCVTQGATKAEALRNVRDAIDTWIEAAKEIGMEIPEETFGTEVCIVEAA